jgi:HK97 family phage major capsid protein
MMSKEIQALRERRAQIGTELNAMMDKTKNPQWNAELQSKYDTNIAEVDKIDGEIQRIEASLKRFSMEASDSQHRGCCRPKDGHTKC